jgi:hypothetical protein
MMNSAKPGDGSINRLSPHPEERALARVSKDGNKRESLTAAPGFVTLHPGYDATSVM